MRKLIFIISIAWLAACNQQPMVEATGQAQTRLATDQDSISYSLGINLASQIKEQGLTQIDEAIFRSAVHDVFQGDDSLRIPRQRADAILTQYYKELRSQKLTQYLQEGRAFLDENKKRKNVKRLDSGLQYEILQQGNGLKPQSTSNVKCHYKGMLIDGTVVESTIESGVPAIFPVNGAIPGLQEALKLMPKGSKWKVYIPTELAYGERPYPGGKIKPNMALIYEIELLSIMKASAFEPAQP